jgi:hypothetical protein
LSGKFHKCWQTGVQAALHTLFLSKHLTAYWGRDKMFLCPVLRERRPSSWAVRYLSLED